MAEYAERRTRPSTACSQPDGRVVVEGGSGLYLRAVLGDLAFGGAPDAARRRGLEARWEREPEALVAELRRRAPGVAARVDLRTGAA